MRDLQRAGRGTMSGGNEQQTSAPYSMDVLDVHDKDLVFAREYGTNVTDAIGDAFFTLAGPGNVARIDARRGLLVVETPASGPAAPNGFSFPIPDLLDTDKFPLSPFVGPENRFAVLYAHLISLEMLSVGAPFYTDLVFGSSGLIGDATAEPFATFSIDGGFSVIAPAVDPAIPAPFQPQGVQIEGWTNGATPLGPAGYNGVGNDVYVRALIGSDGVKSSITFDYSVRGFGWTNMGSLIVGPFHFLERIGLATRINQVAGLDWLRIYKYVVTGSDATGFTPAPPITGGRRWGNR